MLHVSEREELEASDEELMARVRTGEIGELDALFRRHANSLFGFFYGAGVDPDLSKDLVQEVFWRILRYRDSYDEERPFRAWIYRIARNVLSDCFRRNSRMTLTELDHADDHADGSATDPSHATLTQDDQRLLREALSTLSPDQREILVLARLRELSFREVGEILGCAENTAKVRAFRALQALRIAYQSLSERTSS